MIKNVFGIFPMSMRTIMIFRIHGEKKSKRIKIKIWQSISKIGIHKIIKLQKSRIQAQLTNLLPYKKFNFFKSLIWQFTIKLSPRVKTDFRLKIQPEISRFHLEILLPPLFLPAAGCFSLDRTYCISG